MILPRAVGVSPSIGWSEDATTVNVTYVWDVNESGLGHANAFCRFGAQTFPAESVSDDIIVCTTESRPAQTVSVAISFDGMHWSIMTITETVRRPYGKIRDKSGFSSGCRES
jgi:hypothetical protein